MKRARILLNSSEGVQSCVSPREGYGSQGPGNPYWPVEKKKQRYDLLMKTSGKHPEDKVNHMIRNPTTYHINHMISNGQDHRQMWQGQTWTKLNGYGHHVGPGGHHGAPKIGAGHWTLPYQPASWTGSCQSLFLSIFSLPEHTTNKGLIKNKIICVRRWY